MNVPSAPAEELIEYIENAPDSATLLRIALDLVRSVRSDRAPQHALFFVDAALRKALELAE